MSNWAKNPLALPVSRISDMTLAWGSVSVIATIMSIELTLFPAAQEILDDPVNKRGVDPLPRHDHAVVQRRHQLLGHMSDIHVSRQFAARHRARDRNLISGLLLAQISPTEVVRELPIVLRLANQGPEHRARIIGRQKLRRRTQVVSQVRLKPTKVGWIN